MNQEQWNRLKTVFQGALDRSPEERRAWLEQACAGDASLLREAEALLGVHETAGDFLEAPAQVDPADLEALPAGTRLGPYFLIEEIGRGGMGIVYLAEDERLGRRVALKSLPMSVGASVELRERLRREARAAATISHPAVATVFALEELDGQLFIVSEYVAGETLRSALGRGPLTAARARAIAADVARALCAAHEAGVVHRDLKPENVLVTTAGGVKVVDFGIAHIEGPETTRLTRAGAMLGTPAYMAPEQLLGTTVDARADIYAFGVVLAEMVGRHVRAGMSTGLPTPSGKDTAADAALRQLLAIADRCMQPDPASRYANARELLGALAGTGEHAGGRDQAAPGSALTARWWWEFHQAAAAVVYWIMIWPGWRARGLIGGGLGRAFFLLLLSAVIVAATLRLHLWFTSRFYPAELRWARRRESRWIRIADWLFAATLASGMVLIGDERSPLPIVLLSVGIGAAIAFMVIEPATARAAFKERH